MISLFLIGNFAVSSISFLLKKSLFALTINDKAKIIEIMNKHNDINEGSAFSYTIIFFKMLVSMYKSIATNIRENNNFIPNVAIFFLKEPPLKNNLKSFRINDFTILHKS